MPYTDDRIGRLEAATDRLSQNVVGLSTSLALISEIDKRQVTLEKRAALAESKVKETNHQTTAQILTVQEANRRTAMIAAVAIMVLALLLAYTRYESVKQISDRLGASMQSCVSNNLRSEYEAAILEYSIAKSSDAQGRAMATKTVQQLRSLEVDCSKLFGPSNTPHFLQL